MKYRFIREHMDKFHVERMCRILKVSRSSYYAWLKRPISKRKQQDAEILTNIKIIYEENRKTYGSPRIQKKLRNKGIHCGKKRVERIMRDAGIRAIQSKKYIYHRHYATRTQARRDMFEYIEVFYNRIRMHSSIGYMSPENYEKLKVA